MTERKAQDADGPQTHLCGAAVWVLKFDLQWVFSAMQIRSVDLDTRWTSKISARGPPVLFCHPAGRRQGELVNHAQSTLLSDAGAVGGR